MAGGSIRQRYEERHALDAFRRALTLEAHNLSSPALARTSTLFGQQIHNRLRWDAEHPGTAHVATLLDRHEDALTARGTWIEVLVPRPQSSELIRTLTGHGAAVHCCAFAPDTRHLLASGGADGPVIVWDSSEGREVVALRGHSGQVTSIAWTKDASRMLTSSTDGTLRHWDVANARVLRVMTIAPRKPLNWCGFGPDETWAASVGTDPFIRIWDLVTGEERARIEANSSTGFRTASTARGGALIAVVEFSTQTDDTEKALVVRSLPDGAMVASVPMPGASPLGHQCCAISEDATLAAAECGTSVGIWDVPSGRRVAELSDLTTQVTSCVFDPAGHVLVASGLDSRISVVPLRGGGAPATLAGHAGAVNHCAPSPAGALLASAGMDGTVRVWRLPSSSSTDAPRRHSARVGAARFSADGRIVVSGGGVSVILREGREGTPARELALDLEELRARVVSAALAPDQSIVVAGSDKQAVLGKATLAAWAIDPDAPFAEDGPRPALVTVEGAAFRGCAFSPSDPRTLATVGSDGVARLWSCEIGRRGRSPKIAPTTSWQAHARQARDCAFVDGETLVTCGDDGTVVFWRVPGAVEARRLVAGGWAMSCDVSPANGRAAAATSEGRVCVWGAESSEPAAVWAAHTGIARSVCFDATGEYVVTTGDDQFLRVWSAEDGRLVGERPTDGTVWSLDAAAGDRVCAGDEGGDVEVLRLRHREAEAGIGSQEGRRSAREEPGRVSEGDDMAIWMCAGCSKMISVSNIEGGNPAALESPDLFATRYGTCETCSQPYCDACLGAEASETGTCPDCGRTVEMMGLPLAPGARRATETGAAATRPTPPASPPEPPAPERIPQAAPERIPQAAPERIPQAAAGAQELTPADRDTVVWALLWAHNLVAGCDGKMSKKEAQVLLTELGEAQLYRDEFTRQALMSITSDPGTLLRFRDDARSAVEGLRDAAQILRSKLPAGVGDDYKRTVLAICVRTAAADGPFIGDKISGEEKAALALVATSLEVPLE